MTIPHGTRLGHYEVTGSLGAGGMGEVYRARDTTLGREVAIKMLPESVGLDPQRLARFEREARTLAALNHPHIAQIHGLEDAGARGKGLVMELVEGPTLAERVDDGPLPIPETLDIARQIADALECAHAEGIVHRDLKPANIKVRDDGTVKVLDFGLAKGGDAGTVPSKLQDSPTFTSPAMTERGLILGTAAYMSPEQARGKPVDKRADIWAFGVVVFEMLTGRQMFAGETVSDTLAAVLREDVPWRTLPPATPAGVRRVLERCLQKDPKHRLRDIGDARLEIEDAIAGKDAVPAAVNAGAVSRPASRLPWVLAAVATLAAIALGARLLTRPPAAPAEAMQFTQITDTAGEETTPALSPDGATVMFASRARGTWDIYSQRVGGRNRSLVIGDPDRQELGPAFSPDGQQIAFYEADDDGGIFVAGATGESVRRVSEVGFHPAWSPDGKRLAFTTEEILDPYTRQGESRLWVIDLTGGAPRQLDAGDAAQPAWSPSGRRIVFWANVQGQRDLFTIGVDGGSRVPLLVDAPLDWAPAWMPDGKHVMFSSDRGGSMNLWRIAVDEATGRALGPPEPVTAGVQAASERASVSRDGSRIAFKSRVASLNPVAIPFEPATLHAGTPVVLDSSNSLMTPTDVSRDGRSLVLYNVGGQQEDVFVTSTAAFSPRRLTDDAARDRGPVWMPDGRSLLFFSTRGGTWEIWAVNADGGGLRKAVSLGQTVIFPILSPSGDRIACTSPISLSIYIAPLDGKVVASAAPLPDTRSATGALVATSWSPDGHALAGRLVPASGRPAGVGVYDLARRALRQVNTDRAPWVRWMPDSRRLMYFTQGGELVVLDTQTGARTAVSVKLPLPPGGLTFALSPDARTIYYGGARSESDIWIIERPVGKK